MIRPIRTYPDKVLRNVAEDIAEITDDIRRICADMIETMCSARGAGLAANQIGLPLRIFTLERGSEKRSVPLAIINPAIVELEGEDAGEEGCLSVPGFYEMVKRARRVAVQGLNLEGEEFRMEYEGLLARHASTSWITLTAFFLSIT